MCTSPESDRAARETWAAHYATPDGFRYMPAEELVRFCGRRRGTLGRVVEVGCGSGANLWYLAEHSDLAIGVDFCAEALDVAAAVCRRRHVPALLAMASGFHLPLASGSVDTVVDAMVSQHVPWVQHLGLYAEYRRVLRPGGTVFIYHLVAGTTGRVPARVDYPEGIGLFPAAGRLCLPDRSALAGSLRLTGFTEITQRGMSREYPNGDTAVYATLEGTAS